MIPKRSLVIVYDDSTKVAADQLMMLVSQKDDKDNLFVGCPDGSVKCSKWSEKEYLSNQPTITSDQHILFIGENKVSQSVIANIEAKFNQYTIRYGWLGTKGAIYLPQKGKIDSEEYKSFLKVADVENKKISNKKYLAFAPAILLGPIGTIGLSAKFTIDKIGERKKISEQLYRYAVLHFYLNDICNFLNLPKNNDNNINNIKPEANN